MKIVLFLLTMSVISCTRNDYSRVEFLSGEIQTVSDGNHVGKPGDTVIIEHRCFSHRRLGINAEDRIWGFYRGTIPTRKHYLDSLRTSNSWYEVGIKQ